MSCVEFAIGIDPGKRTGFAVWVRDRFIAIETTDFWGAFRLTNLYPVDRSLVIIEVPDTKHVWHKAASSPRALQKQGANVGSVVREAELLAEGIRLAGYQVRVVQPRGKKTTEEFQQLTGFLGRTNQHERDAALLCYKRATKC